MGKGVFVAAFGFDGVGICRGPEVYLFVEPDGVQPCVDETDPVVPPTDRRYPKCRRSLAPVDSGDSIVGQ